MAQVVAVAPEVVREVTKREMTAVGMGLEAARVFVKWTQMGLLKQEKTNHKIKKCCLRRAPEA